LERRRKEKREDKNRREEERGEIIDEKLSGSERLELYSREVAPVATVFPIRCDCD